MDTWQSIVLSTINNSSENPWYVSKERANYNHRPEAGGNQWAYLLPQIHINLGITLEGKGMVITAYEDYREADAHCDLASAIDDVREYKAALKALEETWTLR
ncbi:hypothetical protein L1887_14455 [Cichorium endivia]|nr:hypothetical protein L1887_14455 [Cichorium endivia]